MRFEELWIYGDKVFWKHPEDNDEEISLVEEIDVTDLVVWWQCKKGHEWQATIGARVFGGTGCPRCEKDR